MQVGLSFLVQFVVGLIYFFCNFMAEIKMKTVDIEDTSSGLHIIVLANSK